MQCKHEHISAAFSALISRLILVMSVFCILSCSADIPGSQLLDSEAEIFPDYKEITIPPNIAPLNFIIRDDASQYRVRISGADQSIVIRSPDGKVKIPLKKWRTMLESVKGGEITIDICLKKGGIWFRYPVIRNSVAEEPVDSYVVYRLIDPGFELWNKMGIYQRCVENYNEKPIMLNTSSGENCMNCHSFSRNDSRTMMFHMRAKYAGTVIYRDGVLKKVNTKTDSTISAGVYPSWHPGGRYIAFSVNNIIQTFHSVSRLKTEVTDTLSDLILYDTGENKVIKEPALSGNQSLETFPSWSPDGKYLYFCSAEKKPYTQFNKILYDLLRIPFDEATCTFGKPDTVVKASSSGKSISFPRVSPDGRYLMYCLSDFGNFTIWHPESDLWLKDLETGTVTKPEINSERAESYHSWLSSGRWVVFSSRREDGLFTRLYYSYFDENGNFHKPFILPQKDPDFYDTFLKSYNVPEAVTTEVGLNPRRLMKTVFSEPENASLKR